MALEENDFGYPNALEYRGVFYSGYLELITRYEPITDEEARQLGFLLLFVLGKTSHSIIRWELDKVQEKISKNNFLLI
jgi:hypothetical protein